MTYAFPITRDILLAFKLIGTYIVTTQLDTATMHNIHPCECRYQFRHFELVLKTRGTNSEVLVKYYNIMYVIPTPKTSSYSFDTKSLEKCLLNHRAAPIRSKLLRKPSSK